MDVLVHYRHDLGKIGGLEKRISTNSNRLQIRYASYSANQWLSPPLEALSDQGAFLVPATPPSGRHRGGGLRGYRYCQPEGQDIQGHRQRETVALFVALQEVAM